MSSDLSKKADKTSVEALTTTVGNKADKGEAHTKTEADARFAVKATEATAAAAMPKAGGAFTGAITVQTATLANHPVTKAVYDNTVTLLTTTSQQAAAAMPKSGGTFTGTITVPSGTANGHAVNKGQLDSAFAAAGGAWTAVQMTAAYKDSQLFFRLFAGGVVQLRGWIDLTRDGAWTAARSSTCGYIPDVNSRPDRDTRIVLASDQALMALCVEASGIVTLRSFAAFTPDATAQAYVPFAQFATNLTAATIRGEEIPVPETGGGRE